MYAFNKFIVNVNVLMYPLYKFSFNVNVLMYMITLERL